MGRTGAENRRRLNAAGQRQIAPDGIAHGADLQHLARQKRKAFPAVPAFTVDGDLDVTARDRKPHGLGHFEMPAHMRELENRLPVLIADKPVGHPHRGTIHGS